MKTVSTQLQGLLVLEPDVFSDDRGFFFESYNKPKYEGILGNICFVQDNISKSKKSTIRGLHYQVGEYAQGKLCQVIVGRVLDIAVDIRHGSPTFGKHFSIELSDDNHLQIWIPPGFAHGFSVLSDETIFHYKCTAPYSRKDERTLQLDDPALGIDWKVDVPIISQKDQHGVLLRDIAADFIFGQIHNDL